MRIVVIGAGGVGGYFGGRLALAGHDVTFIARGAHLQAIRKDGLQVESFSGDFKIRPAQVTDNPSQLPVADVVIFAVKTWQVVAAAEAIRPVVGSSTCVLPLGNGVDMADQLAEVLGVEHVLGGSANIFSQIVAPGHIRSIAKQASIVLGELDGRTSKRATQLCQTLEQAGITAEVAPNIQVAIWEKFVFVTPFGGVGAVTRVPVGIWRDLHETRTMAENAMREIVALAHGRGLLLTGDIVAKSMAMVDDSPPTATTSMQRDIQSGRPSELAALTGAVVRIGKEVGLVTPVNGFIYASLLPQELLARQVRTVPA